MKRYWPLVVVVLMSIIGGAALLAISPESSLKFFMVNISGFFFIFLATLKFWDLKGFSEAFLKYDLVAKKIKIYAYLYPFLELIIAIGYLAHFFIFGVALLTAVIMLVTLCGVLPAIFSKEEVRCACMGTKLDIPLSLVTLIEVLGMGTMAVFILIKQL